VSALAKNVANDPLHLPPRADQPSLPSALLPASTQVETDALAADNPSGHPSQRQRRQARDTARVRLEQEAADGRYLRRKSYPILWDAQSKELLVGSTAITVIDRLHTLFQQTFGVGFEQLSAGR